MIRVASQDDRPRGRINDEGAMVTRRFEAVGDNPCVTHRCGINALQSTTIFQNGIGCRA
ncbi:hypothetical protein D3C81_2322070 [compost metagenome]